jgi:hypothetical protein
VFTSLQGTARGIAVELCPNSIQGTAQGIAVELQGTAQGITVEPCPGALPYPRLLRSVLSDWLDAEILKEKKTAQSEPPTLSATTL